VPVCVCVCAQKGLFPKQHSRLGEENPLAAGTGLNFSDLPSAGDDSGLSGRLPAISELISPPRHQRSLQTISKEELLHFLSHYSE
jgi:hypothetical protein